MIYLALAAVALSFHEPWRDEADVWLSVRDSSLSAVLSRASHAGTPTLWYFLVAPLARLGLPYFSMHLLHLLIATAAVAVLFFRSSLPLFTRILFAFSYYMLFEYAVVARNYAIGILLLFLVASLYATRLSRPLLYALLLALLFQTSVHLFLIGLVLAAVFADEVWRLPHPRRALSIAILLIGTLLAAAQLFPRPGGQFQPWSAEFRAGAFGWVFHGIFFPTMPAPILGLLTVGFFVVVFVALRRKRRLALMLASMVGLLLYLAVFKWSIVDGYRHFGLFLIAVLFTLWIEPAEPGVILPRRLRVVFASLNAALAILCLIGFVAMVREVRGDFSGAERMARYLRAQHLEQRTIVAHRAPQSSAVLPYLPGTRLWYAGQREWGTFMKWDGRQAEGYRLSYSDAADLMKQNFPDDRDALLLLNGPLPAPGNHCLRLRYASEKPVFAKKDEVFYLYERDPSGRCQSLDGVSQIPSSVLRSTVPP